MQLLSLYGLAALLAAAEPGAQPAPPETPSPPLSRAAFLKENPNQKSENYDALVASVVDGSSGRYKRTRQGGLTDDTVDPARTLTLRDAERLRALYALRTRLEAPQNNAKYRAKTAALLRETAQAMRADPGLFYPDKTAKEARAAAQDAGDGLEQLAKERTGRSGMIEISAETAGPKAAELLVWDLPPGSVEARIAEAQRSGRVQIPQSTEIFDVPKPGSSVKERREYAQDILQAVEGNAAAKLKKLGYAGFGKGWAGNLNNALPGNPGCVGWTCSQTHELLKPQVKDPAVVASLKAAGLQVETMFKDGSFLGNENLYNHIFFGVFEAGSKKPVGTWDPWAKRPAGSLAPVDSYNAAAILAAGKVGKVFGFLGKKPRLYRLEETPEGTVGHPLTK